MARANVTASLPTTAPALPGPVGVSAPGSYWGSVSGQRIVSGMLSWPLYGAWTADVVLATDTAPVPSPCTVTIGNLTLSGTPYRQTTFAGRTEARIVGGAGGWSKPVQKRGYNNPAVGVLRSQVIADAALEVGETAVTSVDATLGDQYLRYADKASRVLVRESGGQWWIDPLGVTHVGPRTTATILSPFTIESFDGASGTLRIATEDPASWQPGNTFSSATVPAPQTIASVRHELRANGVARLEVMISAGGNDRWIEDIRQIIRQELANSLVYARVWEYVVVSSDGTNVDLFPVDPSAPIPPLKGIPIRTGIAGGSCTPAPGTHLAVGFLDANAGKPRVFGVFDGTLPTQEAIDATALLKLGPSVAVVQIAGGATPIVPTPWATGLATALAATAASLTAFGVGPPTPLTPLGAIGTALTMALGELPAPATTKTVAT